MYGETRRHQGHRRTQARLRSHGLSKTPELLRGHHTQQARCRWNGIQLTPLLHKGRHSAQRAHLRHERFTSLRQLAFWRVKTHGLKRAQGIHDMKRIAPPFPSSEAFLVGVAPRWASCLGGSSSSCGVSFFQVSFQGVHLRGSLGRPRRGAC